MINNRIFRLLGLFILAMWSLQACPDSNTNDLSTNETPDNPYGLIKITENDLPPDVFKLILQDDEPPITYFDNSQRFFYINQPLQVSINEKQELFIRFYSPSHTRNNDLGKDTRL